MNNKQYKKPTLIEVGDVAEMTQLTGNTATADFVYNSNGTQIGSGLGSVSYELPGLNQR